MQKKGKNMQINVNFTNSLEVNIYALLMVFLAHL